MTQASSALFPYQGSAEQSKNRPLYTCEYCYRGFWQHLVYKAHMEYHESVYGKAVFKSNAGKRKLKKRSKTTPRKSSAIVKALKIQKHGQTEMLSPVFQGADNVVLESGYGTDNEKWNSGEHSKCSFDQKPVAGSSITNKVSNSDNSSDMNSNTPQSIWNHRLHRLWCDYATANAMRASEQVRDDTSKPNTQKQSQTGKTMQYGQKLASGGSKVNRQLGKQDAAIPEIPLQAAHDHLQTTTIPTMNNLQMMIRGPAGPHLTFRAPNPQGIMSPSYVPSQGATPAVGHPYISYPRPPFIGMASQQIPGTAPPNLPSPYWFHHFHHGLPSTSGYPVGQPSLLNTGQSALLNAGQLALLNTVKHTSQPNQTHAMPLYQVPKTLYPYQATPQHSNVKPSLTRDTLSSNPHRAKYSSDDEGSLLLDFSPLQKPPSLVAGSTLLKTSVPRSPVSQNTSVSLPLVNDVAGPPAQDIPNKMGSSSKTTMTDQALRKRASKDGIKIQYCRVMLKKLSVLEVCVAIRSLYESASHVQEEEGEDDNEKLTHNEESKIVMRIFHCKFCRKPFLHRVQLNKHKGKCKLKERKLNDPPVQKTSVPVTSSSSSSCQVGRTLSGDILLRCNKCMMIFNNRKVFQKHRRSHDDKMS